MAKRILLIDNSGFSSELVKAGLSEAGFEPIVASGDMAQISLSLQHGPFDALVIDLEVPDALGNDLLEYLREARGVSAPVILFSEIDEQKLADRAQIVGACGYVRKSKGVAPLVKTLRTVFTAVKRSLGGNLSETSPKRKVMVVDDSEMTGKLIEAELAGKDLDVIVVDTVEKATRLILKKQTRPELILLDVNMPNVDGVHFCRFLKANSLFDGIKVVLCSGLERESLKSAAVSCGADGYVAKDLFLSKWVLRQLEAEERF